MTINEILKKYKMTQKSFANRFGVPFRTVQNWCEGQSECKEWMLRLFLFALKRGYWFNGKEIAEEMGGTIIPKE